MRPGALVLGLTGAELGRLIAVGASSVSLGTAAVVLARRRREDDGDGTDDGEARDPEATVDPEATIDPVAGTDEPPPRAADDPSA